MNHRSVMKILLIAFLFVFGVMTISKRAYRRPLAGGDGRSVSIAEDHKARIVSFSDLDFKSRASPNRSARVQNLPRRTNTRALTTGSALTVNGKPTTITASEFRLVEKWIGEITNSTYSIQDSIEHTPRPQPITTATVIALAHYETVRQALEGLKTVRGELENAGAGTYNPNALIALDEAVTKVKELDATTGTKSEVIAKAITAMEKAAADIQETKKTNAQRLLITLKNGIDDAIRHDADIYIPDQIDDIEHCYEGLFTVFNEGGFDKVIALAKSLMASVDHAMVIGAIISGETDVPEHHPL